MHTICSKFERGISCKPSIWTIWLETFTIVMRWIGRTDFFRWTVHSRCKMRFARLHTLEGDALGRYTDKQSPRSCGHVPCDPCRLLVCVPTLFLRPEKLAASQKLEVDKPIVDRRLQARTALWMLWSLTQALLHGLKDGLVSQPPTTVAISAPASACVPSLFLISTFSWRGKGRSGCSFDPCTPHMAWFPSSWTWPTWSTSSTSPHPAMEPLEHPGWKGPQRSIFHFKFKSPGRETRVRTQTNVEGSFSSSQISPILGSF